MDETLNALSKFHQSFGEVEGVLDYNRMLISEINQNHETKIPERLTRNVTLIRELNDNISKVVDLYSDLSDAFVKAFENVNTGAEEEEDCEYSNKVSPATYKSSSDCAKRMRTS